MRKAAALMGKREIFKLVGDVAGTLQKRGAIPNPNAGANANADPEAEANAQPNPMAMIGMLSGLLNKKSADGEGDGVKVNPMQLIGNLLGNENVGPVIGKVLSNGAAMKAVGDFMSDPGVREVLGKIGKLGEGRE